MIKGIGLARALMPVIIGRYVPTEGAEGRGLESYGLGRPIEDIIISRVRDFDPSYFAKTVDETMVHLEYVRGSTPAGDGSIEFNARANGDGELPDVKYSSVKVVCLPNRDLSQYRAVVFNNSPGQTRPLR